MLRTETSGQFHLLTSIIMNEFQMSSSPRESGGQGTGMIERKEENNIVGDDALYDPIGFFIAVGIAYLGFLEDQEVSLVLLVIGTASAKLGIKCGPESDGVLLLQFLQ